MMPLLWIVSLHYSLVGPCPEGRWTDGGCKETRRSTQVTQAPLWGPNVRSHAGSSDWKNSSGWKKVRIDETLMSLMRMAIWRMSRTGRSGDCESRGGRAMMGYVGRKRLMLAG